MKRNSLFKVAFVFLVIFSALVNARAAGKTGTLELIGIPPDFAAGYYETESGLFFVDVTGLPAAWVKIHFEEMQIVGKKLEWHTKDDYFVFSQTARLEKEDFELTGDLLEYLGNEGKLVATGNVEVVTSDATVRAQNLVYEEETDEALFTNEVVVLFKEGALQGEKFLMSLAENQLKFFGAFRGEFETDGN